MTSARWAWLCALSSVRLRRLVLAAEPDLAAKKAREGIQQRRVAAYPSSDSSLGLAPIGQAAAEAEPVPWPDEPETDAEVEPSTPARVGPGPA